MTNSTVPTSEGFGKPLLVTSDHQADETPLCRIVGEHEYDHSKIVKTSKDTISSDLLQSVISTLPTDVQVTDDFDTVSEYQQPNSDLPCLCESCSLAKSAHGCSNLCFHKDIQSRSNYSSHLDELKLSCDSSSVSGDQLSSTNIGPSTKNFQAAGYVSFAFEDFEETQFCPPTVKRGEELQESTDLDSLAEDENEFADVCPLTEKEQKSKDVHYRSPTPEGLQESNYLDSFCKDGKTPTKNSPWIIKRFRNLSFCKWGTQRSKDVQEEVGHRSRSLHKSSEDKIVTPSILDASKSTYRPMPPPSVGRKDNIPFESSGIHVLVHNTLSLIRPMSRAITKTRIPVCIFLLLILQTTAEVSDVRLDCTSKMHLTSPNYPSNYPSDADVKWQVTAPSGRWILVKFNDFNVEQQFDFLDLVDIDNIRNTVRYTGERTRIPSFLTQGNALDATFASYGYLESRGFNITVSCYETSNTSRGRLVGGKTPAEGFLQILSQSGEWVGVCEDNLSATVTEVICGELGYPGVKEISYKTDGCQSDVNDQTCVRAPSCEDNTYLLGDCSFTNGNCMTFSSVQIKCYEPGFKGCYGFDIDELQNGSTHDCASKCISSCRGKASHDIAVFDGEKCFCSNATEVNLLYRKPAQNQTTCPSPVKNSQQIVNALVYNVSVGFCNQTDDVINGTWDSNITWFGSIVHLTCDDGYSIKGNGALQCVPGISSYYPVWNDSMPTCDRFEGGTSSSSSSKSKTPEDGQSPTRGISTLGIILMGIFLPVLIFFICIVLVIKKKTNRYRLRVCLARALMSIRSNGRHPVHSDTEKNKELQRKGMGSQATVEEEIEEMEEMEEMQQL